MFTGLIEEIGTVESVSGSGIAIACSRILDGLAVGDSVSVDGVCLTAVDIDSRGFRADTSPETAARSTLGHISRGGKVNLERALAAGQRLGGHFVQGHVDGTGRFERAQRTGDGWTVTVDFPSRLERYIVLKGSIAVNGISLTVASLEAKRLNVAVIPHTWERTTLQHLRPGDAVNIEVDILAKYVERMLGREAGSGITEDFLKRHGFGGPE
jgi:riboflavin synthase